MERLSVHLALHGVLVVTVSVVAGVLLYRNMLGNRPEPPWHLVHAGGTVRGVLLIALAGILPMLALPPWLTTAFVWVVVPSIWSSMFAMFIAAASGERGHRFAGSATNRLVFVLYGLHVLTIFPACAVLIGGSIAAL